MMTLSGRDEKGIPSGESVSEPDRVVPFNHQRRRINPIQLKR